MTQYQPRHRRSQGLRYWLLGIALATTLVVGLAAVFRTALIESTLISVLETQGFEAIQLDVQTANLSRLEIGAIDLGNGSVTARSLKITYSLTGLRQGKVSDIKLSGLLLQGAWTETGVTFPLIERIIAAQRGRDNQLDDRTAPSALDFGQLELTDAEAVIEHPKGPIRVSADITINHSGERIMFGLNGTLNGPDVQASTSADGSVHSGEWQNTTVDGIFILRAADFLVPGQNQPISADIELSLSAQNGELRFGSERDVVISGPWPGTFEGHEDVERTFDISLRSNVRSTPFFEISTDDNLIRTQTDLHMLWATPLGRGSAEIGGWAILEQDGIPQDFNFSTLNMVIESAPTPIGTLSATISADGLRGPLTLAEGPVTITARLLDGAVAGLSFAQIDLDAETTVCFDAPSLSLSLASLSGQMRGGTYGSQVALNNPITYSLADQTKATQTATLVFDADGNARVTLDTALQATASQIEIAMENSPLLLSVRMPEISIEGSWVNSDNAPDFTTSIQNAELISELASVSNISALLSGNAVGFSGPIIAHLKLPNSRPGRSSAILENTLTYSDNRYNFEGVIKTDSRKTLGKYAVAYHPNEQLGQLNASIGPIDFGGSDMTPSDLRPLSLPFTPTSGQIAASVSIPFGLANQEPSGGSMYVKDLELEASSYAVRLLNAAVDLKSIWPIKTDGPQKIAIGLLQAGVPLTNVLATFDLPSPERIEVADVTMSFAEGQLDGGPFSIDLSGAPTEATLKVNEVSLPALANLSTLEGLDASGVLSGLVPLTMSSEGVLINQGKLVTSGPGYIRYKLGGAAGSLSGTQASQGGMGLALQALENFQYDSITVTVNGSVLKELEASLAIKGRNPALYNGYPIDFNLNLSGELANVIQGSLAGYRVPETIKRQLMAFPPTP